MLKKFKIENLVSFCIVIIIFVAQFININNHLFFKVLICMQKAAFFKKLYVFRRIWKKISNYFNGENFPIHYIRAVSRSENRSILLFCSKIISPSREIEPTRFGNPHLRDKSFNLYDSYGFLRFASFFIISIRRRCTF